MPHYKYLIIGGGMTADAAVTGIREVDPQGSIGLIGTETHPPYNRPSLSKGLWKGTPIEQIWCKTGDQEVGLHLGRTAKTLDIAGKRVTDDQSAVYTYDKLLIATGGVPRRLAFGGDDVIYFRTFDDFRRLRALADERQRFAVIGGGFIGSEIAAALAMNGKEVVMAFPGAGIGANVFPQDLSRFLNQYFRDKGVKVLCGQSVTGIKRVDNQLLLSLSDVATAAQQSISADGIVAGLGITPETGVAEQAGIAVENGVIVNELLQAGDPDIYAAGDVANFYNPALDARLRLEHEDNALSMGRHAGRNMAGESRPYHYHASFYSDLFELGYEAVGRLDARMKTVEDWSEPYRKGVVYYLQNERVKGVLLWNVWDRVPLARELIAQPGPYAPADLYGRL